MGVEGVKNVPTPFPLNNWSAGNTKLSRICTEAYEMGSLLHLTAHIDTSKCTYAETPVALEG